MQDPPPFRQDLISPRGGGDRETPHDCQGPELSHGRGLDHDQGPGHGAAPRGSQGAPDSPNSPELPRRKRPRQEPTSRADVAYLRKRATAACRLCRSRKVKCNNVRPSCGNCTAHEAICDYEDSSENISAFDPASIAILEKLTQVLTRLDHLPNDLRQPPALPIQVLPDGANPTSHHHPVIPPAPSCHATSAARVELAIPAAQAGPESVLQWPILALEAAFPSTYMIDALFEAEMAENDSDEEDGPSYSKTSAAIFNEDEVLELVQSFLDFVHIKNPVLEPDTIWAYARRVAEEGPKWDASSCLVLLACALGSVAQKFPDADSVEPDRSTTSLTDHARSLRRGEGYFNLARRRLGLVQKGLLAPQCRFLAGVYLMYTLRPLQAWAEFHSASRSYHIYLQCQARKIGKHSADAELSLKRRRLEQRLYWSCYKSECELRAEMDLPNSSLASFHYPDMHPSPPDMDAPSPEVAGHPEAGSGVSALGRHCSSSNQFQEESWYYYLTEITLRRLANEIYNAFYANGHQGWNDDTIGYMAKAAREFEQQVEECYNNLPSIIRFEDNVLPSRELPYMVRGRLLEIRCSIHLPFLFYAIHNPRGPYSNMVQPLAQKALQRHFSVLLLEPLPHRHHGTWYGVRHTVTAALCVLAAARSGTVEMPEELDWKDLINRSLDRMRYWADEAPGIARSVEVLASYLQQSF